MGVFLGAVRHRDITNAANSHNASTAFWKGPTMRKLQIPDSETVRKLIHQELVRSEESRYGHRLHGLLLLTAGLSCGQVAALLGEDSTTVQRWVRRFERGGLEALREGKRSGRPRLLGEAQWQKLAGDLRMDPREFGLPAKLWSGRILSEHLHLHYAVDLGIRQSQRIFRRLSSGRRKPFPRSLDRGKIPEKRRSN